MNYNSCENFSNMTFEMISKARNTLQLLSAKKFDSDTDQKIKYLINNGNTIDQIINYTLNKNLNLIDSINILYHNSMNNIYEHFGIFGVVGKVGAKVGAGSAPAVVKIVPKTGVGLIDKVAMAARYAGKTMVNNPKLTALGFTAAGIGTYAALNNMSFAEATDTLAEKTAEELSPIASAVGGAVGDVAGDVIGAGVGVVGSGVNSLISSITGIPIEYLPYIWYTLGILFVLSLLYKFYSYFK
jgi:hypothetical protein